MKFSFLFALVCAVFHLSSQGLAEGSYRYKISPLLGAGQTTKTYLEFGFSSEWHRGSELLGSDKKNSRDYRTISKYFAFAQSVSAELYAGAKPVLIPKYSFWLHSNKMFIFSVGSALLYTKNAGVFMRSEAGLIFPRNKMAALFGIKHLRIKLTYGYVITFNGRRPEYGRNCIAVNVYFGNNSGRYRMYRRTGWFHF
jgi:hypothetical protein